MTQDEAFGIAEMTQIFGSELLRVQNNFTSESKPQVLVMDPKQILMKASPQMQIQAQQKSNQMLQNLQQQAEALYPLPPPIEAQTELPPVSNPSPAQTQTTVSVDNVERIVKALESITESLNLLATNFNGIKSQ